MNNWIKKRSTIVLAVLGLLASTSAWAQGSEPWQVTRARNWLETGRAEGDIQLIVHSGAKLQRADYRGAQLYDDGGFRIWYDYYWKSVWSGDNNRTQIAFDIDANGYARHVVVTEDTSFLPAFAEAGLGMDLLKKILLNTDSAREHPDFAALIKRANAVDLLLLDLNLVRLL